MKIQPKPSTTKGPSEWFTGDVWIDSIVPGGQSSHPNIGAVHFSPGARTAWHSHQGGQTLYVTEGRGLAQTRGEQLLAITPGDVINIPDGEEHWHGAAPEHFMTHLSITVGEASWGAHLTDEQYRGRG